MLYYTPETYVILFINYTSIKVFFNLKKPLWLFTCLSESVKDNESSHLKKNQKVLCFKKHLQVSGKKKTISDKEPEKGFFKI